MMGPDKLDFAPESPGLIEMMRKHGTDILKISA